jgi:hypothetical protein
VWRRGLTGDVAPGGGYDGRRLGLGFRGGGARGEEGERDGGAWKKKKRERGEDKGLLVMLFLIATVTSC